MAKHMRSLFFVFITFLLFIIHINLAFAGYNGPELKLPMQPGNLILCTTAAGGQVAEIIGGGIDKWHTDTKNGYYAIDFDDRYSSDPVLATADGTVAYATNEDCYDTESSCYVKIDHGSGYVTKYLHMVEGSVLVNTGDHVTQGQVIGTIGDSGIYSHGASHLHFEIEYNGNSYSYTDGLDGVKLDGIAFIDYTAGNYYNSTNDGSSSISIPPRATKRINNKANKLKNAGLISTGGNIHWYNEDTSTFAVQDWDSGTSNWQVLTYAANMTPRPRRAYTIRGGFWWYYRTYGNVAAFGPPLGDELDRVERTSFSPTQGYDPYCVVERGFTTPAQCITDLCDNTVPYAQRFQKATLCWNADGIVTVKPVTETVLAPPPPTHIDSSTFTYSSLDLTSQASVDYADLSSHPTCAVDEADSLYVVLTGQNHRIYELKTTNDGTSWSSTDLSAQASVPYSAAGTSPQLFIDPDTGDRYVTFMGDNARIQLFRFHGGLWTAVDLTNQASVPYADPNTSPFGYIANGVVYVVFSGSNHRIYRFAWDGTTYSALDLSAQANVMYAQPGTSPMAVYNESTEEHHIVFQGDNYRIQRLTWNGTTWSSVEITSVINSDLLDSLSQPWTYVDSATGYVYTVINGVNQRIDYIVDKHTSWSSAELTSIISSPLVEISSSPVGYIDPFTGHSIITFLGDNLRINQFEGSPWTNGDLTAQTPVMYAASGTSPATCMDTTTGVRHIVFVGDNARIQYLRFGP